jgi:hypothetical protein
MAWYLVKHKNDFIFPCIKCFFLVVVMNVLMNMLYENARDCCMKHSCVENYRHDIGAIPVVDH